MLPASASSSCCRWSAARRRTFCGLPAWTNFDGKIVLDASDPLDFSSGRPEALSLAWVVYSDRTGKTHHAFKLVGK